MAKFLDDLLWDEVMASVLRSAGYEPDEFREMMTEMAWNLFAPMLRVPHPAHGCEVDVKVDLPYTVHFADGPPVMDTLEVIKTKVFETLTEFRAEFK